VCRHKKHTKDEYWEPHPELCPKDKKGKMFLLIQKEDEDATKIGENVENNCSMSKFKLASVGMVEVFTCYLWLSTLFIAFFIYLTRSAWSPP
jgi:hypothetical protein